VFSFRRREPPETPRLKKTLLIVALSACGTSIVGPGGFTPNTELAQFVPLAGDGGINLSHVNVLIAYLDKGTLACEQFPNASNGGVASSGRALAMVIANLDGTPLGPGTYAFVATDRPLAPDAGNQVASVLLTDSAEGALGTGVSGSLILAAVSPTLTGTFTSNLVTGDGGVWGTLSGGFDAGICTTPTP
jgi:hypothetical protein